MTPSQARAVWRLANDLMWDGYAHADAEAVERAEAVILGAGQVHGDGRDIDARCQPIKANPERYDSEGRWRS